LYGAEIQVITQHPVKFLIQIGEDHSDSELSISDQLFLGGGGQGGVKQNKKAIFFFNFLHFFI